MILDHTDADYIKARDRIGKHRYNGAYYYSKEIVKNIIPYVHTDRNWVTISASEKCLDHSIFFVHNNMNFEEHYEYTKKYKDVVYIVGLPDMVERAEKFGETIYLPLSIDVEYVKRFKRKFRHKKAALVGRPVSRWMEKGYIIPNGIDILSGMPRDELLTKMSDYEQVFAIGRCAIEAKVLGCEVLPFHPRLMNPDLWKVLDNRDAAKILQKKLNEIDGRI